MTDIIRSRITSESSYDDNGTEKAEVIPLFRDKENGLTGKVDETITYQTNSGRSSQHRQQRIRKDFTDKISFDQIRNKADQQIIDYAFHLIADALDYEIGRIEQSNLFDEWKDSLDTIIAEVSNITVNHRKILGAIIVATKGKDIADFHIEELRLLREATYLLRQSRVTKSDSKRIIKALIDIGGDMAIPLASDDMSDKDQNRLDQLMKSLIKRSK